MGAFLRAAARLAATATVVVAGSAVALPAPHVSAAACAETGEGCAVGMVGPRGGIVFYDAGSQQWWGRFLEAERVPVRAGVPWGAEGSIYAGEVAARRTLQRASMAIGMGRWNTEAMRAAGSPVAASVLSAGQDWFIPSKDELGALYDFWRLRTPAGLDYGKVPVWTSTESEDAYAWYQLFHDGTQFTDANGVLPRLASNKWYLRSPLHVGSGFLPAAMRVIRVRAFPAPLQAPGPPPALVAAAVDNPSCAQLALGCRIGDVGPGGGIVVHDAGSAQPWGRYLEVAPKQCEVARLQYARRVGASLAAFGTQRERVASKALGAGERNTRRLHLVTGAGTAAAVAWGSACGGKADWFLPSKDELNEAFRWLSHSRRDFELTPAGQFERGYYWTSSDYNGRTAWTQYFADGQQFDRVQLLSGNRTPPYRPFLVRPMRAFFEGQPGSARP